MVVDQMEEVPLQALNHQGSLCQQLPKGSVAHNRFYKVPLWSL